MHLHEIRKGKKMKRILRRIVAFSMALVLIFAEASVVTATDLNNSALVHDNKFSAATVRPGIDVSSYQGNIDWTAVANSGVQFAFIRMAYRESASGIISTDTKAIASIQGALNAGLQVGVYIFSQAINEAEAVEEADYICNLLNGYNISLPVVMDYEYKNGGGRLKYAGISKAQGTSNAMAFCARVASRGFIPMVYANKNFLQNQVDGSYIDDYYHVWLANYTNQTSYTGDYTFWQHSSKGSVDGISGNVDCDVWYDFGSLDRNNIIDFGASETVAGTQTIYRLYNRNTGEHLYTPDANEVQVLYSQYGWGYEGVAWYAAINTGSPVYRLYNPVLGNHLYTTDLNEINVLTSSAGWVMDNNGNPLFYSDGTIPIYRLYNEGLSGMHHLTTDANEYNVIPQYGWTQEGVAISAVQIGNPIQTQYK